MAGACATTASSTRIDKGVIRLVLVVSLVFGGLGYVATWKAALLPAKDEDKSPVTRMFGSS